jgi:hypothetical protein
MRLFCRSARRQLIFVRDSAKAINGFIGTGLNMPFPERFAEERQPHDMRSNVHFKLQLLVGIVDRARTLLKLIFLYETAERVIEQFLTFWEPGQHAFPDTRSRFEYVIAADQKETEQFFFLA